MFIKGEIEMNKLLLAMLLTIGVSAITTPAMARRGADDPASQVRHVVAVMTQLVMCVKRVA